MPAIRLAVAMASTALAMSRHPLVRAGLQAALSNPRTREVAANATRNAAYNAGVVARHILGRGRSS